MPDAFNLQAALARLPEIALAKPWVQQKRQQAVALFEQQGIPTRAHQDWRYTPTQWWERHFLTDPVTKGPNEKFMTLQTMLNLDAYAIVIDKVQKDVYLDPALQALGVTIEPIHVAHAELLDAIHQPAEHGFAALNSALFGAGVQVIIPEDCVVPKPLMLMTLNHDALEHQVIRHVISLKARSQAVVYECYQSTHPGCSLTNAVSEYHVSEGAQLQHVRLIMQSNQAYHIDHSCISLQAHGRYVGHCLPLQGRWIRNDTTLRLEGEKANAKLYGLYVATQSQLIDHHIKIIHQHADTQSETHYRGIIADQAHTVFSGHIVVPKSVRRIDAKLMNKNILLSSQAKVHTMPELQIDADDVQCTHGATVGQLDPQALYYLAARGLNNAAATRLLLRGFAKEIIDTLIQPECRDYILRHWFSGAHEFSL